MIKLCKHDQKHVIEKIRNGKLDALALSTTNLIDDIILGMHSHKVFDCLKENIPDKRANNTVIPYDLVWASAIAAKMKVQTSLTDIPYAINDHKTLAEFGYTIRDDNGDLKTGLMQEGSLRFLLGKYDESAFIDGYNKAVQKGILPLMDISPDIHILDCTDLEVNYFNTNYEKAGVSRSKRNDEPTRGYKLSTLRGIVGDTGIIEDIRFGSLNTHDLALSEDMLKTSPMLKPGDILIEDRGFLSRELVNYLKTERKVDTYVPLRRNMESYKMAVLDAKDQNNWESHPSRKGQKITLIDELGENWRSNKLNDDVPINACVVWDTEEEQYFVFVTTDTGRTAREIIQTYELRPEIEEDYRQLKDFWKLEDFKSTKYNVILFHVVCVLFGYLFFQLYTLMPEGEKYLGKSLPVILKSYIPQVQPYVVLYVGEAFGVLTLYELMELFARCDDDIKLLFKEVLQEN